MKIDSNIGHDAPPKVIQKRFLDISRVLNGSVEFGNPTLGLKNIQGYWLSVVTPGVADTEFIVTHNLGYIPTGIIVFRVDKAAIIYASQVNLWNATQIRLKCNVATVALIGFVA